VNEESPKSSSVHHRASGFRNPWPAAVPPTFSDVVRWVTERRRHRRPDPSARSFTIRTPTFATPRAPAGACTITWVGHSTFLLQLGSLNVLTDPMWSSRASPVWFAGPERWVDPGVSLDRLPPIDLVLQSHDHYDHLDTRTVRRLARGHPRAMWYAPIGVERILRRNGISEITTLDWWAASEGEDYTVTCAPAQHFSGRSLFGRNGTLWCSWVIRTPHHALFFAGDTAYHPEFSRIGRMLGPFSAVLLPIGAYEPRWFMRSVHVDPGEAVQAYDELTANSIGPRCPMIGMHWGTFKLADEPMDEPPRQASNAWKARGFAERDLWVFSHGETRHL
jgi:N-acyl-phosphatidylethanolamine-hydrolysing phospholipase D